jgi:hypothetical protein
VSDQVFIGVHSKRPTLWIDVPVAKRLPIDVARVHTLQPHGKEWVAKRAQCIWQRKNAVYSNEDTPHCTYAVPVSKYQHDDGYDGFFAPCGRPPLSGTIACIVHARLAQHHRILGQTSSEREWGQRVRAFLEITERQDCVVVCGGP